MKTLISKNTAAFPIAMLFAVSIGIMPAGIAANPLVNPVTRAARQFTEETGNKQPMHIISVNGIPECSVPTLAFVKWLEGKLPRGAVYDGERQLIVYVGRLPILTTVHGAYFDWLIDHQKGR